MNLLRFGWGKLGVIEHELSKLEFRLDEVDLNLLSIFCNHCQSRIYFETEATRGVDLISAAETHALNGC